MNRISTEISITMRGGVPKAMIDLGNMCTLRNLIVNTIIMLNTLILVLLEYKITSSLGII